MKGDEYVIRTHTVKLTERLAKAASFVRQNAVAADIGTDHAKLPIYLLQTGRASSCLACDINPMPLERAKANINEYGLGEKIVLLLTDGLRGIEEYGVTDVIIAGMGGELIQNILENSKVKKEGTRFILQPMTKEAELRRWLYDNGYDIVDEVLAYDGKLYQIICSEYDGKKHNCTETELLVGRKNIEKKGAYFDIHIEKCIKRTATRRDGLLRAGLDANNEEAIISELQKLKTKGD